MKFIWEVKDIKPENGAVSALGSIIMSKNENDIYILGYRYTKETDNRQDITITSLADGLMIKSCPVEEIVAYLNSNEYKPFTFAQRISWPSK